ncbi:phosphatidylethanolamine-binding protein, partial [Burkholderia cenocepacia]
MRVDRRITPPAPSGRPSPFLLSALLCAAVFAALPARAEGPFTVTSDDLTPGARVRLANVFDRGDCKGANRSP